MSKINGYLPAQRDTQVAKNRVNGQTGKTVRRLVRLIEIGSSGRPYKTRVELKLGNLRCPASIESGAGVARSKLLHIYWLADNRKMARPQARAKLLDTHWLTDNGMMAQVKSVH